MAIWTEAVSQTSSLSAQLSGCGSQSEDLRSADPRQIETRIAGATTRGRRWIGGLGTAALAIAATGAAVDLRGIEIAPVILALVAIAGAVGLVLGMRRAARLRVAIVGDGHAADRLADRLATRLGLGGQEPSLEVFPTADLAAQGFADDGLVRAVNRGDVDVVAVALPPTQVDAADRIVGRLSALAVDVVLYDVAAADAGPVPAPRRLVRRPLDGRQLAIKDLEDRLIGALLLLLLAPVLALVALAVKMSSPGPVLFKQKRHGFRGQEILVYKFRTMRREAADYSGRNQTQRGDPRITRIGRILRSTSLDELPQLLNVVRGEMSLVGPRPHPIDMRTNGELCQDIVQNYESRHRVRPGITGWAQINGYRGATTTREQVEGRVLLDNHYIDNWSLLFDLRIMALTTVRLFADDNAY